MDTPTHAFSSIYHVSKYLLVQQESLLLMFGAEARYITRSGGGRGMQSASNVCSAVGEN